MQSGNITDLFEACKCGMLCVNVYFASVYNSTAMFLLEQRLKPILKCKRYQKTVYHLREFASLVCEKSNLSQRQAIHLVKHGSFSCHMCGYAHMP